MARPLVSVIIINYNAGKLLQKAVKSVLSFEGIEVVVADNASKDTSFIDLAKNIKAKNLILIDNGANLGFGKAVSGAVAKSHGEYIYLLNPDASLKKSALIRMVETAKAYGNRAVIAPRLENPDGSAQPSCYPRQTIWNAVQEYWLGKKGRYSKYLPKSKTPVAVHAAVAAAWLVPRAVWDELDGLSPRYFLYFEDLDFCDRASQVGIPIIYDPRAVVTHHHGVSSRTNPVVLKLFTKSAWTYHGSLKKLTIDGIIRLRDLVTPPLSLKKLAFTAILYSAIITAITALGYFVLPSRMSPSPLVPTLYHNNFLYWSSANFDGEHYLRIARDGYQTIAGQSEFAFFPLYPLLIRLFTTTGLSVFMSAHLVTFISFFLFMVILVKWGSKHTSNPASLLWLTLLSPGAIFLLSLYTESLFLLLAVATFYLADRGRWGPAIFLTALASATRVNGLFLVLFLLLKMTKNKWQALLGLSGLAGYMVYLYHQTGDALAWYHAQSGWGKSQATWPWETASRYLQSLTTNFVPDLTHLVVAIEVLVTCTLLYLLYKFWVTHALEPAYKWYVLASLALPLATGSLGSMPRFALALFPLYLVIPTLSPKLRRTYYALSLLLAAIGIVLFTRGYWYA